MESGACAPSSLPEVRCSMSETPTCGDEEELDEETMKCISALYKALGPLMPAVTQLQSHQEPPAHLMVDMKAKLKELGSSVSDARKKMLRYNIYLKKKLARAMQERIALREQLLRPQDLGTEQPSPAPLLPRETQSEVEPEKPSMETESIQEMEAPEILQLKPSERAPWRERRRTQEVHFAPEEASEDQGWAGLTAEGFLRKIASKVDNILGTGREKETPQPMELGQDGLPLTPHPGRPVEKPGMEWSFPCFSPEKPVLSNPHSAGGTTGLSMCTHTLFALPPRNAGWKGD